MVGILGDVMIDQLASIRDYPEEGSETIIRSLTPRLGGSACNTAMVLSDLVGRCLLFSQIGDDEHGHLAVATLMKKGVIPDFVSTRPGMPTGMIIIMLSPDGSRTMFSHRPSHPLPDDEGLEDRFISRIDFLHLSGYVLLEERDRAICHRILDKAAKKGLPISLDPGISPVKKVPEAVLAALDWISYFIPNEKELLILTQSPDLFSAIDTLGAQKPVLVIKRGEMGCLIVNRDGSLPVPSEKAVVTTNTTGAGDGFNAGFIYGLLQRWPLERCARLGNQMGRQDVSSPLGIPGTSFYLT